MAGSTTTRLIRARRAKVYATVADIEALASCLQPEGTSSRIIAYDHANGRLRMDISHGPGPGDTRRFHLVFLEKRQDELAVYGAEFETDDPLLAGEMRLHFSLTDAPGGTRVTVRHEGLPTGISVTDNERGTDSSLRNLAGRVERRDALTSE
jgi:uncharacterized protein YndB with AHSA1/START domain